MSESRPAGRRVPGAFYVWQAVIAAVVATALVLSFDGWRWDLIRSRIRRAHPELMQVSTRDLTKWLAEPEAARPLLLDVRTRPEFEVGHLPGALWVAPDSAVGSVQLPASKDGSIVAYCSIGDRSAAFGRRLRAAGYTRVFVLEGGIFTWADEGRVMMNDRGRALTVHPRDRTSGLLLDEDKRAPEASPAP